MLLSAGVWTFAAACAGSDDPGGPAADPASGSTPAAASAAEAVPGSSGNVPTHELWTPAHLPEWTVAVGSQGAGAGRSESTGPDSLDALHAWVTEIAAGASAQPYREPVARAAEDRPPLSYDQYRRIRYDESTALWGEPGAGVAGGAAAAGGEAAGSALGNFRIHFFHPGGGFDTPVRFYRVRGDAAEYVPFSADRFIYGDETPAGVRPQGDPGYAGFKVLFPLNEPGKMDEVVAFLGASYFRLLGAGHVYGLSSRGVAVNTTGPSGEEFPDFVAFWLIEPEPGDSTLTFHGLLDGPSITGAYRFELTPGAPTTMAVDATLFGRSDVDRLGVAPLTSMYLHGTFRSGGSDDVRPRVHDSEGLLMATGQGEWIWRPLSNRTSLSVTSLRDVDPQGFGLFQRDRDFGSYLDLEALYHRRPSQWVAPESGDWGQGGVELVEIPTESEFNDNIVAYWAPDGGLRAGERRTFRYTLATRDAEQPGQRVARVVRTRIGWDALPGQVDPPPGSQRRVVVDFRGVELARVPVSELVPVLTTSSGEIRDLRVQPLPDGGRRVTFALIPEGDRGADLRLFLVRADGPARTQAVGGGSNGEDPGLWNGSPLEARERVMTETWSYLWDPVHSR